MKIVKTAVLAMFSIGLLLACQKAAAIEYVKYDNELAVPRMSAEEAKKEYDAGNVVFVDSRGDAAFNVEHLPGAMSIAYTATGEKNFDMLPKGKKIVIYCS